MKVTRNRTQRPVTSDQEAKRGGTQDTAPIGRLAVPGLIRKPRKEPSTRRCIERRRDIDWCQGRKSERKLGFVNTEDTMSPRTIFLSKLIGLYSLIIGLAMFAHRQATIETIKAMLHNGPVLYVSGVIALAAGLALVLGHNVWRGGALPVVVTLIGWLSLIKGVVILFLSVELERCFIFGRYVDQRFYVNAAIAIIVGAYLSVAGFRAKAS